MNIPKRMISTLELLDVQMTAAWARDRFAAARVARLATVRPDGRPHLVPIVFAVLDAVIFTAVDGKPKSSTRLARLANIAANPAVTVLADEYDEDWTQLWWARADGVARVLDDSSAGLTALRHRYPQYEAVPLPGPVIAIDVARWSGWSAGATWCGTA
jgi:PPOX class probable F420-dependent enzyme